MTYDDDGWLNPGTSLSLDTDGEEGQVRLGAVTVSKPKVDAKGKVSMGVAKKTVAVPLPTPGNVAVANMVQRAELVNKLAQQTTKPGQLSPTAKKVLTATAMLSPVGFTKMVAGAVVKKAKQEAVRKTNTAIAQQHNLSKNAIAEVTKDLKTAVATGVLSPQKATEMLKKQVAQIKAQDKTAVAGIKKQAKAEVGKKEKDIKNEIFTKAVKGKIVAIDKQRQRLEDEYRKIASSKMPEATKKVLLQALKDKMKALDVTKKQSKDEEGMAKVTQMVANGLMTKEQGAKVISRLKAEIKNTEAKKKGIIQKAKAKDVDTTRLFVLGKWIQAYESAIAQAQSSQATFVVLPLRSVGVGKGTQEVRMPLQDARVKLEKMKMEYNALEKKLQASSPTLIPPGVVAVTRTGQPVTPEMFKAQIDNIRQQIASGKLNSIVGAKMIKDLQNVQKLATMGSKPIVVKKKANGKKVEVPRPVTQVVVNIPPEATRSMRAGEREIRTKSGSAKTKVPLPKPGVPSAIPHAVARTPGQVAVMVKQQATAPTPKIAPAMVSPSVSTSQDKILPKEARMGVPQAPRDRERTFAPFKRMSLNEMLELIQPKKTQFPFFGEER